ncbi:MAG TPA: alpha/beta fold hydrolase [Thermoanaerobaculia bacterium]|nr:alpha/beta fold hydrolase [Thermoanaerobaculia bacterium]
MLATALLIGAALYRSGHHLYSLTKTDSDAILLLDYDSGQMSRLRIGEGEWVGGPSIGVESPVTIHVRISGDRLTINSKIVATRVDAFTVEHVAGGTLYVPRTRGRHQAIVGVPGAGDLPAPYFARRGVMFLALNRRTDWRNRTFENVADDVVAAVDTLQKREDVDPRNIGVYASSQGGWVAPIAASKSAAITFLVCAACPATDLSAQELVRTAAELRADGFSAGEIAAAVEYRKLYFDYLQNGTHRGQLEAADEASKGARWYPRFGGMISRDAPLALWWQNNERFVPTDYWKRVHIPTLLLFGSLDTRVPPSEHAPRIAAANPAAKIVIVPNVDHEGFIAKTGGRDEVPLLDRIPPRAIEPTIDWILARR